MKQFKSELGIRMRIITKNNNETNNKKLNFLLFNCQGDICQLERSPGPCRDFAERFYFDSAMETCQSFPYGGCEGKNFQWSQK